MRVKIERIGESFRLLLPKEVMEQCGFGQEATMVVQDKRLIVTSGPRLARQGWADALRALSQQEIDRDFAELGAFRETADEWDTTEWQWPCPEDEKI